MYVGALYENRRRLANSFLLKSYLLKMAINVIGPMGPAPTFSTIKNSNMRKELVDSWEVFAKNAGSNGLDNWSMTLQKLLMSSLIDGRSLGIIRYHEDYPAGLAIQALPKEVATYFAGGVYQWKYNEKEYIVHDAKIYDSKLMVVGMMLYDLEVLSTYSLPLVSISDLEDLDKKGRLLFIKKENVFELDQINPLHLLSTESYDVIRLGSPFHI